MKKIIDAHCHFLTAGFLIKEVFAMAKYHFFSRKKSVSDKSIDSSDKLKNFLDMVKDYYVSFFESSEDVFLNLTKNYHTVLKDDSIKISFYPLMMDIFFMYHNPILSNSAKNIVEENSIDVNNVDFIELYNKNQLLKEFVDVFLNDTNKTNNIEFILNKFFKKQKTKTKYDEIINKIQYSPGYIEHLIELIVLEEKYKGKIFPFLAVDPRRKGIVEAVPNLVSKNGPFYGIKLYPRLGYEPDIHQLTPVYEFCNNNNIPITIHCSAGGFPPKDEWEYSNLSNPELYNNLISKYPNVNFNFAHFGHGNETWRKTIVDYIVNYNNVYTDLSCYTSIDELKEVIPYKEKIKKKVMFGSDFTVASLFGVSEKQYLTNFDFFNSDYFDKMTDDNPKKFLNIENLAHHDNNIINKNEA